MSSVTQLHIVVIFFALILKSLYTRGAVAWLHETMVEDKSSTCRSLRLALLKDFTEIAAAAHNRVPQGLSSMLCQ